MSSYVLPLRNCTPAVADAVGGKAVGLGALLAQGLPVPAGFAVTTLAYRACITPVVSELSDLSMHADNHEATHIASVKLRALIEGLTMPVEVADEIRQAYLSLDPAGQALVAVRSSATAEDLADASFAGQQDTYLGVRGVEEVLKHVVRCWGSLFTPQVIGYRRQFGVPVDGLAMSVVVQQLVEAQAAGVMMTLDPTNGDRSTVFISAAHGLGEGVVKGDVESDSVWVGKSDLNVTRQVISRQREAHRFIVDEGRVAMVELAAQDQDRPAITAEEAIELARIAVKMEVAQDCPQDLEWAVGPDPDGRRSVYLLQSRPETVWSNRPAPTEPGRAYPPALHGRTHPHTTWTTTNVGESVPGVPTPLGWSMWSVAGELATRSAFRAIGALSRSEAAIPATEEDRLLGIFHGRVALNVDLVCAWAERVPGTDGATMAEQIFSARPQNYVSRKQYRYYPVVAAKAGLPLLRVKRMVHDDRAAAETFRASALADLKTTHESATRRLLEDALEMHRRCLSTQTLLTLAVCQPVTDRLLQLATTIGFSGEELMAGYGGHDETAAVSDMWACSRGTLDLETFLTRHGFHAWQEGELSARSWREDPTPVTNLISSYRQRRDDANPAIAEKQRMDARLRLETEFLASLPADKRPLGRLLLRLARNYVPLRGIAKGSFVQSVDVVRAAARRLGTHLHDQGVLAHAEDVFYLTLPELRGGLPVDVKELVKARREERQRYEALDLPTVWHGAVEATLVEPVASDETILGTGASPGVVEGRARVVTRPDDARVEQGEILVARDTDPSWASLMFLSAGLIADIGGVMSHTAIVARELSLPCVVNTKSASKTLRTGDLIRLNGERGTVDILERVAQTS